MTYYVWRPEDGEDESYARADCVSEEPAAAAEREAARRFDPVDAFTRLTVAVMDRGGIVELYDVAVEARPEFVATRRGVTE